MRRNLIQAHFDACTAAVTPAELESALAAAHAELSESEYNALLGKLASADNLAYELGHLTDESEKR